MGWGQKDAFAPPLSEWRVRRGRRAVEGSFHDLEVTVSSEREWFCEYILAPPAFALTSANAYETISERQGKTVRTNDLSKYATRTGNVSNGPPWVVVLGCLGRVFVLSLSDSESVIFP